MRDAEGSLNMSAVSVEQVPGSKVSGSQSMLG